MAHGCMGEVGVGVGVGGHDSGESLQGFMARGCSPRVVYGNEAVVSST